MFIYIFMNDTIPKETRNKVNQRSGGHCEICGERQILTLHHLHYDTVGVEEQDDLQALCWTCHKAAHRDLNGDYWKDPKEMESHWRYFCEEMEKDF